MERAPGLHDLSDERKVSHASGLEARGALLQIDRLRDVLGDDEVGVARRLALDSEAMKSVIAQRSSGLRASANDGIGVPFNPVLIVLKMSSRDDPPRKVQRCARSAARIG